MARRFWKVISNRDHPDVKDFLDSSAFVDGDSLVLNQTSPAGMQIVVESAYPRDEDGNESTDPHHQPVASLRAHPYSKFTQEPWSGTRTQVLTAQVPAGTTVIEQHNYLFEMGEPATGTNPNEVLVSISGTTLTVTVTFTGSNQTFRAVTLLLKDPASFTPDLPDTTPTTHALWKFSDMDHRAFTHARAILRHPLMPKGITDIRVVNAFGNQAEVPVTRYGDYLIFNHGNTSGPFIAYWNQEPKETNTQDQTPPADDELPLYWHLMFEPDNPSGPFIAYTYRPPIEAATFAQYQTATAANLLPPNWSGVEPKVSLRSVVVRPDIRVLAGWEASVTSKDYTPFVTRLNRNTVTVSGPAAALESDTGSDRLPRYVFITTTGGVPITAGMLVRSSVTPYANGRELTFTILPFTQFHDIDLSMRGGGTFTMPSFENDFVLDLLKRAGYPSHRDILIEPGIEFRDTSLWTKAPPHGPGFSTPEAIDTYWSDSGHSSTQEIKTVLQANMLDMFDAPDGSVYVAPIIPKPELSLLQLVSHAETNKIGFTLSGNTPTFNLDNRLSVQSIDMALEETFAKTEVEGTSNTVEVQLSKAPATFVQGPDNSSLRQQRFYSASAPGMWGEVTWPTQAEGQGKVPGSDAYNDLPRTNRPWSFAVLDGSDPKFEIYPERWFHYKDVPTDRQAVVAKQVDSGSSTRRITASGWLKAPISSFTKPEVDDPNNPGNKIPWYQNFLSSAANMVPEGDPPLTGSDTAYYGIWAQSTGRTFLGSEWEFTTNIAKPDSATMKLMPLLGEVNIDVFAPKWFPNEAFNAELDLLTDLKPRKAKTVQNKFITAIGQSEAVQKYVNTGTFAYYDTAQALASAQQLATWLTLRDILRTRKVTFKYAGTQPWWPGKIMAVARRPRGFRAHDGSEHKVDSIDLFLIETMGAVEAQVGGECWTTIDTGFIGTVHYTYNASGTLTGRTATYHMPSTWGSVYGDN